MPPVVELRDIDYVRNGNRILSGVSWTIEPGRHAAILGANGSGKTSLLKIVTAYEWPTEGEVYVLGNHYGECDVREIRKHIGWVSSALEHQLPTNHTGLQVAVSGFDASIGLFREPMADEWNAARTTLDELGIGALAERTYQLMSQGEQQRVLIARGMVCRPALMILDEPCAGLDPAARERFLDDLGRLARKPDAPTLILVTHHIDEIRDWIAQVLIIKSGRVIACDTPAKALTAQILSDAFNYPFTVENLNQRYYLKRTS